MGIVSNSSRVISKVIFPLLSVSMSTLLVDEADKELFSLSVAKAIEHDNDRKANDNNLLRLTLFIPYHLVSIILLVSTTIPSVISEYRYIPASRLLPSIMTDTLPRSKIVLLSI